jgi:hypothetical protein
VLKFYIVHSNFDYEIEMVIDDYKYLIKMMLNSLNNINNETKFEWWHFYYSVKQTINKCVKSTIK